MDEVRQFLTALRMARQYFLERLEIVAELPRTPSGKIQKFKLREQARELSAAPGANLSEPHQRPL
jgi:cyclohexanecarboxylate-CoA ligase